MFVASFSEHKSLETDKELWVISQGQALKPLLDLFSSVYDTGSVPPARVPQSQTTAEFAEKGVRLWCLSFGFVNQMAKGVGWVHFHCLSFLLAWTFQMCLGKAYCVPAPHFSICVCPCCPVCISLRAEPEYGEKSPAKHGVRAGWFLSTCKIFMQFFYLTSPLLKFIPQQL